MQVGRASVADDDGCRGSAMPRRDVGERIGSFVHEAVMFVLV